VEITEVRIKLAEETRERLHAFCSITIDGCFVVRDLKIIEGTKGPFVAMPSRKLTDRCARCHGKNCLRATYCGQCGVRLPERRGLRSQDGRSKLYADIAHPINSTCREAIQSRVLEALEHERVLARQPGYVCRYDDFAVDDDDQFDDWSEPTIPGRGNRRIEPAEAMEGPHTDSRPGVDRELRRIAAGSDTVEDFGAGVIGDLD
jgi:stage V sporulation protein G